MRNKKHLSIATIILFSIVLSFQTLFVVSCKKDPVKEIPTLNITTTDILLVTSNSFNSGGKIINDGGSPITARGVCWSTNENPTIMDYKTSDGTGPGSFTSSISGLTPDVKYYVRAYATNDIGTMYGNQLTTKTTAPLATTDFGVDSTTLFINDTAQFINLWKNVENVVDTPDFKWYFQGGTPETSDLLAPSVKYSKPGSFPVKLIVTYKTGQDSVIKADFIKIYGMHVGKLDGIEVIRKAFNQSISDADSFDINKDGIYDIRFEHTSMCCRNRYESIDIKSLNKTQISTPKNSHWAKKHEIDDVISPKLNWTSGLLGLSGLSQSMDGFGHTTYGNWGYFNSENPDGYICFRINNEVYGWIELSAYTSFFGSNAGIGECAYFQIKQ
jgi:PKD repeat protein